MKTYTDPSPFAYDAVAYPTRAQSQVPPERLAAVGALYGLDPAPVEGSRILELGCGDAANLACIAAAFPGSRCVGLDLSGAAIERGLEFARRCGLANLELHQADLAAEGVPGGEFDYILCHGLYAWVPEAVREGILRRCREQLAPEGLAMISYNALPGGCVRQAVRDMLRWHVRESAVPLERLGEARALAQFLSEATHETDEVGTAFRSELRTALAKEPGSLFHDDLAEHYAPVYFHEFMAAAGRHSLQFVAGTDPAELFWPNLAKETLQIVYALTDSRVERQQYLDFLVSRRFHHTVLCREECTVAGTPQLDRLSRCWFSAQGRVATPEKVAQRGAVAVFQRPDGAKLETDFVAGKLALAHLIANSPRRSAFADLGQLVRRQLAEVGAMDLWTAATPASLAQFLLEACAPKLALMHGATPDISSVPGDRPRAFAPARVQAAAGDHVTTAYHHVVVLGDRWSRELVSRADGTRTRAQLKEEVTSLACAGDPADLATWQALAAEFDTALNKLARQGLLVA